VLNEGRQEISDAFSCRPYFCIGDCILVVSIDNSSMSDEFLIREFIKRFAENPNREGLKETPARVIKAWNFFCSGYNQDPADVLKCFEDGGEKYDELLFQANIPIVSSCEHHLEKFWGMAHIAYVPNGKVVGLSKLSRLAEIFARRLQVQERLTQQIADALMEHLQPKGVGVVLQMRHGCMEFRGIQKVGTITMSSALRGCVKNESDCRAEFMALVTTASQGLVKL
jgi:GTP cyclohydrolase I